MIEEYVDGSLDRNYVHGNQFIDELVLFEDSSGDYHYYLQDFRYTVYALVDDEGTVEERYRFDPYGKRTVVTDDGSIDEHYGFTGRYHDDSDETDLIYFRNRWMSGEMGRFVSRDPLEYQDGMNLYTGWFVVNNTDFLGYYTTPKYFFKLKYMSYNLMKSMASETEVRYRMQSCKDGGDIEFKSPKLLGRYGNISQKPLKVFPVKDIFWSWFLEHWLQGPFGLIGIGYVYDPDPDYNEYGGSIECTTKSGEKGKRKWKVHTTKIDQDIDYFTIGIGAARVKAYVDIRHLEGESERIWGLCCACEEEDDKEYDWTQDPDYEAHYGAENK